MSITTSPVTKLAPFTVKRDERNSESKRFPAQYTYTPPSQSSMLRVLVAAVLLLSTTSALPLASPASKGELAAGKHKFLSCARRMRSKAPLLRTAATATVCAAVLLSSPKAKGGKPGQPSRPVSQSSSHHIDSSRTTSISEQESNSPLSPIWRRPRPRVQS